ncbi:MAG: succinylglutamate desuccinylase/aspartoacylase family protein [Betaproteobacteria bacterium]|nr:succinylglutamate desuccinylase/aspartoacylase family protein [Betaproteobacteria bacterium]
MSAEQPLWSGQKEGRFFTRIDVTTMLNGAMLALPLHVITGRSPGPTFGIITNTHGDEFLATIAIRQFVNALDMTTLKGRIALVSVANPMATAHFGRQTPEQHGRTDLHEVYPGNARGNTTQMIAAAITENVLHHVDALIDFHSGGSGGRLQARVDYNSKTPDELKRGNLALARAFGAPFVHENEFPGAAAHYLNGRGIPAVNPEVGGSYLGPGHTRYYTGMMADGLSGMMRHLGMLDGAVKPPKQLHFDLGARREIRPRQSGYLVSHFERPDDLGRLVRGGAELGEVIDIYSYRVLEKLVAPADGYLFFSRYSGMVGGGTQAFALAEAARSNWLD